MQSIKLETDDIRQLAGGIWGTMFSLELGEGKSEQLHDGRSFLTGCIQLSGAWDGAVVFHCSEKLANALAMKMFGTEELSNSDLCDAVGELTNLLSGAMQSLVPAPSELTPPSVVEGKEHKLVMPRCKPICETAFECMGEPFTVIVFDANSPDAHESALKNGQKGSLLKRPSHPTQCDE